MSTEEDKTVSADDVELWMDRFVSASSSQDAMDSLRLIVDAMKKGASSSASASASDRDEAFDSRWVLDDAPFVENLVAVLQTRQHRGMDVDDGGVASVCQLFLHAAHNVECLRAPAPGRLLEALLDVASGDLNSYARVSALQTLHALSKNHGNVAQAQWLRAPNGLHRLADMLSADTPEVVRNQALLVAHVLARHTSIAKVLLFVEVETQLLNWCWAEGGLTRGQPVVLDALKLVHRLVQSADAKLHELLWMREPVAPRLAQLMDLRGGVAFLHPEEVKKKAPASTKPKLKPSGSSDDLDDLDDLMQTGKKKEKSQSADASPAPPEPAEIPCLTEQEEEVVHMVLRIIQILLSSDDLRPRVWKQHAGLCSLVWELALVSPAQPPVCALPSPKLQQAALELVACFVNDPETMDRHAGVDRLLYLVCTGGGTAKTVQERLGLSQAALHVLRKTLGTDRIHEILAFSLAPPPPIEDANAPPVDTATVVQKLWNTVAQNLQEVSPQAPDRQRALDTRKVFLSGAFGGLAIFLQDDTSREMMFRAMPEAANMDRMLELLSNVSADGDAADVDIPCTILRFLCEWVQDTPLIVQKLLSSNESMHLATLAYQRPSSTDKNAAVTATPISLVHLLLGLSMAQMARNDKDSEEQSKYGGWTRAGILQIITKVGISRFTSSLERPKNLSTGKGASWLPWMTSELEWNHWREWYNQAVWVVRKRVVEELTGGGGPTDGDEDDPRFADQNGVEPASSASLKPLQKLIARQTEEMDNLKDQLADAQAVIAAQVQQLDTWKRRAESNPTQLDELLSEMSTKNDLLNEKTRSLEKELVDAHDKHTSEMQNAKSHYDSLQEERDETIASQRATIETLTAEKREAEEDRDRAEQDLQNLSHTYTTLETEFQRLQQEHAAASSDEPLANGGEVVVGDDDTNAPQQEESQAPAEAPVEVPPVEDNSAEVAALREEIEQLRNDARNADAWMAQAVDRMNGMGAHNANLESQINSYRQQIEQLQQQVQGLSAMSQSAAVATGEIERLQQQLQAAAQQEQELRQHIEALSQQHNEASAAQTAELAAEQQQNNDLSEQLAAAHEDARQAIDSLGEMKAEKQKIESDLVSALQELDVTRAAAPSSQPVVVETRDATPVFGQSPDTVELLATKDAEIQELTQKLEEASRIAKESAPIENGDSSHSESAIASLNEGIAKLQNDLAANEEKYQREIYEKESQIRELQNRLEGDLSEYKLSDIHSRDAEIAELQASNEAAQAWMANAVEHHGMLSSQVASLTEEKATLTSQLEEANARASSVDDAATAAMSLELNEARAEIQRQQSEVETMRQQLQSIGSLKQQLQIAQDHVADLQRQLDQAHLSSEQMQSQMAQAQTDNASLRAEVESLKSMGASENATINNEIESLRSENGRLQASEKELLGRLDEFQAWVGTAQTQIAELFASKTQAESQLDGAQNELEETKRSFDAARTQLDSLTSAIANATRERDEASEMVKALQAEKSNWEGRAQDSSASIDAQQTKISELTEEITNLRETLQTLQSNRDDLLAQHEERQTSSAAMQDKLQTLSQELSDTAKAKAEAESSLRQANDFASRSRNQVEMLKDEVQTLKLNATDNTTVTSAAELFGSVGSPSTPSHVSAPDLSEDAIAVAQQVDGMIKRREQELRDAKDTLAQDEEIVNKWEERVEELESTVKSLERQLEEHDSAADDAISEWQERFTEVDDQCTELEAALASMTAERDCLATSIAQLQESLSAKERQLADLEAQMKTVIEQRDAASSTSTQWQESHATIEKRCNELDAGMKTAVQDRDSISKLMNEQKESLSAAIARCSELEGELNKVTSERDELSTYQESQTEKEARIADLENQLNTITAERDSLLSRGEETKAAVQSRCSELEGEIQRLTDERQTLSSSAEQLQESYSEKAEKCIGLEKEIQSITEERDSLVSNLEVIEEDNSQLEEEKNALSESIATLEKRLSAETMKQFDSAEIDQKIKNLEEQLRLKDQELQETLARDESVVNRWQEAVNEHVATIDALSVQLKDQETEANDAITQWQESYTTCEERCTELEQELSRTETALAEARDQNRSFLAGVEGDYEEQIKEMAEKLEAAQDLASEQERERQSIQKLWSKGEITIDGLKKDMEKLQSELVQSQQRSEDSELVRKELEETKAEVSRLSEEFKQSNQAHTIGLSDLEEELSNERNAFAEAREKIKSLSRELEDVESKSDEVINQWTEKVDEMEAFIAELEEQLVQQGEEAENVITIWEEKYAELEAELETATKILSELRVKVQANDFATVGSAFDMLLSQASTEKQSEARTQAAQFEELTTQIRRLEEELAEKQITIEQMRADYLLATEESERKNKEAVEVSEKTIGSLSAEVDSIQLQLVEAEKQIQSVSSERVKLQEEIESRSDDNLEKECKRLASVIEQLQEELRDAEDMTRAFITDEMSEKATDVAAHSMREEIESLKYQVEEHLMELSVEKSARIAAEENVERLTADLEALLPASDQNGSWSKVQLLSVKATEKKKKKERNEIESLRKSLSRALDELEVARNAEKEAIDKLSSERQQAGALEQEILSAKANLTFMTDTVEEMREAEETMRVQFEYRIGSLENDYDVLRRYHTDQIKSSQNELTQAIMERDRIQQTLKEYERKNAALFDAASISDGGTEGENTADEISRLRIECAHFKTAAGEEKSKAERRLREVLAAQASSAEADVITEQELRIAAEGAVRACKAELKDLQDKTEKKIAEHTREARAKVRADLESLGADVKRLKLESRELKNSNSALKRKLEETTSEAQSEISALREECRNAQARAHKLASEKKHVVAVEAEMASMRARSNGRLGTDLQGKDGSDWLLVDNKQKSDPLIGTHSYDVIQKQKEAIQEERNTYLELLEEHDTLLAFLTQQVAERDCLKQALLDSAGQGAIDAAMEKAMTNTLEQYGKMMEVS